jgi:hypothetical protein
MKTIRTTITIAVAAAAMMLAAPASANCKFTTYGGPDNDGAGTYWGYAPVNAPYTPDHVNDIEIVWDDTTDVIESATLYGGTWTYWASGITTHVVSSAYGGGRMLTFAITANAGTTFDELQIILEPASYLDGGLITYGWMIGGMWTGNQGQWLGASGQLEDDGLGQLRSDLVRRQAAFDV